MDLPYRLVPLTIDSEHLELVRRWRNMPEVRRNMLTRHEITPEEHRAFFERLRTDPTKAFYLCETSGGEPVGVVSFVEIDHTHATACWGMYSGRLERRGIGRWLAYLSMQTAFGELELEKVWGDALEWNPVFDFYLRCGFRHEGTFRAHHVRDGRRFDVLRIGLLASEWEQRRPLIEARLLHGTPEPSPAPGERHALPLRLAAGGQRRHVSLELLAAVEAVQPLHGIAVERECFEYVKPVPAEAALELRLEVLHRLGREVTLRAVLIDQAEEVLCRAEIRARLPEEGA